MRKFLIAILLMMTLKSFTQSTKGLTGVRDTSFTNYRAYLSTLKTHPNITLVDQYISDSITENKNLPYCVLPGRRLELDKFESSYRKKAPATAVVIVHGGGWRTGNRTQHYPLAQRLAALGYTCFTIEYRLSTEELYPAALHDVKAAIRWLRLNAASFNIDTNKIAVLGFSAGGELAAMLGATNGMPAFEKMNCNKNQSSMVNAVIDIDGTLSFLHPESGEGDDSKSTSAATYWFGYSKTENPALWKEASPLTHVGKHTPPTLFLNSAVARMHAGRTDFINVLNQYAIYSEVHEFEGAPHSFVLFDPWFEPSLKYIDGFLKKVFEGNR